jgi:3-phosphoshikimate 1-carboxyvinyltransferase
VPVPGDKSISHRYALFGAIADGKTSATHLAPGADVAATVACLRGLGVRIEVPAPGAIDVYGRGRDGLSTPVRPLDAANSGTTMRLLSGILAGCPFETNVVGDESLSRRPMRRVIDPLVAMGARIESNEGRAPLRITGGNLRAIRWNSLVASAQVKSAIMLAGLVASGRTTIVEPMATRDHTERAFPAFGLRCECSPAVVSSVDPSDPAPGVASVTASAVSLDGGQLAVAPTTILRVPGDPSTAAVWAAAAAALPGSSVDLLGVCLNPHRLGFVRALERMGADIRIDIDGEVGGETVGTIHVRHRDHCATTIEAAEVPSLIDELPVLAARAALGCRLEVSGAAELRVKESDRITALISGFRAMGVEAEERADGFVIDGGRRRPAGGTADAAGDHRLVMAFALVALGSTGASVVTDAGAVGVSYPGFVEDLQRLTE